MLWEVSTLFTDLFTSKSEVYFSLTSHSNRQVFDSPHLKVLVGKGVRKRLDAKAIVQLLRSFEAPLGTTKAIMLEIFQISVLNFLSYLVWMTCAYFLETFLLVCPFGTEADNALLFFFPFTKKLNNSACFPGIYFVNGCLVFCFWTWVWVGEAVDVSLMWTLLYLQRFWIILYQLNTSTG